MAAANEMPSQASRAEAVAEAGAGADSTPPTAIPSSEKAADPETAEDGHTSPSSSTNGVEAKDEKPVAALEGVQRSKGKTALIMLALCV